MKRLLLLTVATVLTACSVTTKDGTSVTLNGTQAAEILRLANDLRKPGGKSAQSVSP